MINKLSLSNLFRYKPELTHTSSDGQKYQVTVDSLLANHSFKYFGKDKGVSMYTFLDDTHSFFSRVGFVPVNLPRHHPPDKFATRGVPPKGLIGTLTIS